MTRQGAAGGVLHLQRSALLFLLVLSSVWPRLAAGQEMPASPVAVKAVQLERVEERRLVTGELRSLRRARVASLESGRVQEAPVLVGEIVDEGAILVRLDDKRLQLQLATKEAQLAIRRASRAEKEALLAQAQRDETDLKGLLAKSSAARQEYEAAITDRIAAEARLQQALAEITYTEAEISFLRERLEDTVIRAPFALAIVKKSVEVGDWIGEGDPVVEAVDCRNMEAHLAIPEQYTSALTRAELVIPLQLRALGKRLQGRKPRLVRDVDPDARTLSLIIPIEAQEDDFLAPGMSVVAWIPTGREGEYLLIPRDALLQNSAGFFVYVVTEGEMGTTAVARQIDIVFETNGTVAIHRGNLQPNDEVIVEGNERLYPSAPVRVVGPGTAAEGEA
jgi:RND family efflux transporter MFP subunit